MFMEFVPLFTLEDDGIFDEKVSTPEMELPLLPLKNTVLFPGIVIPITINREKSIKAIQTAYDGDKMLAVLTQKDTSVENPDIDDLSQVGTVAKILKLFKMPDGNTTAFIQGRSRFFLDQIVQKDPYFIIKTKHLAYQHPKKELQSDAINLSIRELANRIIDLMPNIPQEANVMLKNINSLPFLINFIATNLGIKLDEKQKILELNSIEKASNELIKHMHAEIQLLELKDKIDNKVKTDIEKQQKDFFLNQQLRTIQDELGQNPHTEELERIESRAKEKKWSEAVFKVFEKEKAKLLRTNPMSPDYGVTINYIDWLLDLPWGEFTEDKFDLKEVKKILDEDHFGLDKVKDRIIEHLAVLKLKGNMKAPILCLVGPPGVGKTSLGESISKALGRKYIRMSLGGLHDEAEIRGHRKTYIGAMPGKIIQSLKKVQKFNPVFILDEIDKVGKDFRGDPSSALLEVLDPEQNSTFMDNFLEIETDLSKVLFVATANSLNTIQPALLDRMEIIELSGYSVEEKIEIAKKHLIPEQIENHGLKKKNFKISDATLEFIIQHYTKESGVRSLNRCIASLMRHVAKAVVEDDQFTQTIKIADLHEMLGVTVFDTDYYKEVQVPGVAVGLAWTPVGGDILFIEASKSAGKGNFTLTGNLGDVMKESATTALSFLKANASKFDIDASVFDTQNIHIHVPQGAIPKDGPSAGITMLTVLASIFTNRKVKPFVAMTGEITLRGKVLPVGGIKEKILAAKRAGMKEIILCNENKKNIEEINKDYVEGLTFHYVEKMDDVIKLALV
ncbi:MAG: endopeptidase La [Saprospiraceae bacterium]|nr:endopeptidase La [Saprospiraceae bacterium]